MILITLLWALVNSSVVRWADGFCLCLHRRHQATTLISLVQDEYRWRRGLSLLFVVRQIVFFCSGMSPDGVGIQIGQFSCCCLSHSGPCFQMFGRRNSLGVCPREIKSAGLSSVDTCRQSAMLVFVWISATRFATNVFNVCGEDLIHWSTIVESVQYTIRETSIVREFFTTDISEVRSNAPLNSGLGIVRDFSGATFDRAVSN